MTWEFALPVIWAGIIAMAVFLYVLLDGFDLGIGILFLTRKAERDRDLMMNTVAPVWDGNETWLVIGGAGLMGTFPLAYSVIMPALYMPLIIMLIALVFRGVCFEFRFKAESSKHIWDYAFFASSTVATLFQGVNLGAFLQGFPVEGHSFAGNAFDWLTPFSLIVGAALLPGYALLGSTWLVMKTEGAVHDHMRKISKGLLAAVIVGMGVVSLWVVIFFPDIRARWFTLPTFFYLMPVPLLTAAAALTLWRALRKNNDTLPFVMAVALFGLGYLGLGVSRFPNIIAPDITIWDAASDVSAQGFMLVGAAIVLPVVLGYTFFVYRVFRGKLRAGHGYEH